jgi:predicted GH43/DUF377 family glycosyl hydrolase
MDHFDKNGELKMAAKWTKLGLIFRPNQRFDWMFSHAQLPVADRLKGNVYRVYFASRTKEQRSHIGYVELDITNPYKMLCISEKPILIPGPIGFFDEHGVFPASIVNYDDKKYLYYIGWNQGYKQPLFYASIGLAISTDNGQSFQRYSKAPILSRSEYDPCLVTSPHVFIDGDIWRMTYVSGIKWEEMNGRLKSYYHIKYAESKDGIQWDRKGIIAVDFQSDKETNIARSSVIREDRMYKMWYCYWFSTTPYRIGYAESKDCIHWMRKDELAGITASEYGFDNEMICYPNVLVHNGRKYMLYNGNNFGREGFGFAMEEK